MSRLRLERPIFLVGFMGSGKTTVGKLLASQLQVPFVDLDEEIERQHGMTIFEMFKTYGEKYFREIEHEAIRGYAQREAPAAVIALGGGAFAQPNNIDLIQKTGISIWLDVPLEELEKRVLGSPQRPLAQQPEKFRQLYEQRRPFYAQAHLHIEAQGKTPGQIVEEILDWLERGACRENSEKMP